MVGRWARRWDIPHVRHLPRYALELETIRFSKEMIDFFNNCATVMQEFYNHLLKLEQASEDDPDVYKGSLNNKNIKTAICNSSVTGT